MTHQEQGPEATAAWGRCIQLPASGTFVLANAHVPTGCIQGLEPGSLPVCVDSLAKVDIEVVGGQVASVRPAGQGAAEAAGRGALWGWRGPRGPCIDLRGKMVLPTFADLHTHIDKGHTSERSRNPNGSLTGADRSTAADANFWDEVDVYRRMDFSLRCAYAHGTSALRTHLINMSSKQTQLTWPAFARLRREWTGKVELQGVSLVVLSYFRDEAAATALADTVAAHGGILGAAVCCAEFGGSPDDDWTTCDADRDELLDRIFRLAKERDLDLDFHTDENGNELARGLRYVAQKTEQWGYQGRVVCGHCCSLAFQPPEELAKTLEVVRRAGVTVVSLPLVNQWTQDRAPEGGATPRWRGVTLLHELRQAGIPTAISSDNVRDQFYAYGDLDMLEVFTQSCRIAHLDRPYGDWPQAVTSIPADAMHLPQHGRIGVGLPANFIIFRGRRYSELLSRPQFDRVVVRNGVPLGLSPPSYEELDYVPAAIKTGEVPVLEVSYDAHNGEPIVKTSIGEPVAGLEAAGTTAQAAAAPAAASPTAISVGGAPVDTLRRSLKAKRASGSSWGGRGGAFTGSMGSIGRGGGGMVLPIDGPAGWHLHLVLLLSCFMAALAAVAGSYPITAALGLPRPA